MPAQPSPLADEADLALFVPGDPPRHSLFLSNDCASYDRERQVIRRLWTRSVVYAPHIHAPHPISARSSPATGTIVPSSLCATSAPLGIFQGLAILYSL
jgi:hypothetical protein